MGLSKFLTAFATRLRIHAANDKATPTKALEVVEDATEGAATVAAAVIAYLQNNALAATDMYLALISGTAGEAGIDFGDKDAQQGRIYFDNATGSLYFKTAAGTVLELTSAGAVTAPGEVTSSGNQTIGGDAVAAHRSLNIRTSAASWRNIINFYQGGNAVWQFDNSAAALFTLGRYVGGVKQDTPIAVTNSTGAIALTGLVSFDSTRQNTSTPTAVADTNISSITSCTLFYTRLGNHVWGQFELVATPTAGAPTLTKARVPLPFASLFSAANQAGGGGKVVGSSIPVGVYADGANDQLVIEWHASSTSSQTLTGSFDYRVI